MSGAELLADDADVDYDAITQRSDQEEHEREGIEGDAEGAERARARAARVATAAVGDVGDSHRKPDPQATAALVDTALSRVQRCVGDPNPHLNPQP
jgi:hypothetical protein